MKLTRLVVLGVTTLGLLGLQGVPFAAADGTKVIRTIEDFGMLLPDAGLTYQSCEAAAAGKDVSTTLPTPVIEKGPAPVPLGSRTWGYATTTPGAVGPLRLVDSMAGIAADQMRVYSDSGTAEGAALAEVVQDDTHTWYGVAPLSAAAGSWQTVQGAGSTTYTWREENTSSGATEGTFTGSITQMLAHVGGDRPGYVGLGFGCETGHLVHFDDVQLGTTGDVATYDFEGGITTTSIAVVHRTVTAGRSPRLTGSVSIYGEHVEGAHLSLQRRAFGKTRWHTVASLRARSYGEGDSLLKTRMYLAEPTRKTSYRWRYLTNESNDGSVSKVLTVRVHTGIRAHAPTRAAVGSKVRVTGRTLPKKPGQRITLWRGNHLLDATRVRRHGTYVLTTRATFRGNLKLVVRIGKSPGNLRGWKTLTVKVR